MAYCYIHLGDFQAAMNQIDEHLKYDQGNSTPPPRSSSPPSRPAADPEPMAWLWKAICHFGLGQYKAVEECALRGPPGQLQNRILFHMAHKIGDEGKLMIYHQKMSASVEDQLSLAAMHFLRGHYQEATDVYKRVLLEQRDNIALNVYVALCYYKLDYYDVSLEILNLYLNRFPDSLYAINIKACNHYKLYNGSAAESAASASPPALIRHNLSVFRSGENALQVFPPLMSVIPEARINLCIYYLHQGDLEHANDVIKDLEPTQPEEYILKAVVYASIGQEKNNSELLKQAQQYFQIVGASSSHCDTIPGRQCMAQCFFLLKQFDDVNIYLKSIAPYLREDDSFNYNFGIAQACAGHWKGAEQAFDSVKSPEIRNEFSFIAWRARTHIHNDKPHLAWEAYLSLDVSSNAYVLLQEIANTCYSMGHFFYSLKAFNVLERIDSLPEYWEGKKGAFVGAFQMVLAKKEPKDSLPEMIEMLRSTSNPQVEYLLRTVKKWAKDNGVALGGN
ncbi:hypothetical protein GUITHDRAFT_157180 [Guillardia theta CCMP2712]|uniref:Intraflagellar transport protein 56 n=1 Tax=Guillardia theta (strain CCMP2712) TaxID=905079 RepID=L1JUW0_GUITC|nr:hypothetical protein GUITHDRAFT_157180 [Guillardia theta CCMP2712]EKX51995.1 hypothetical protein GUITHDRAFT_157180 [Guillardia theta CCMP2712]|eukprot:XP_005838975.1 hypothetical protein GUITHDRAFT_157180 [Guillardia theta CCMP2712]